MALLGLYESKKERKARLAEEEARRLQERLQERVDRENQLGLTLSHRLSMAASRNKVSNVFPDGHTAQNVSPIQVESLPRNGNNYTILAVMADPTCFTMASPTTRGYPILQIGIALGKKGRELSVFYCPYGPSREHPLEDFEPLTRNLEGYTENYRLFPKH